MTSISEPLVQIVCFLKIIEMLLMMPFIKIALMVLLGEKGVGRDLEKKYLQMKSPESPVQNQDNFTEMVLMLPST